MAVIGLLLAPAAMAQSTTTQYLAATGYPTATMMPAPPAGPLLNFDPLRDTEPGLYLKKSTGGATESDPEKYQLWALTGGVPIELDGPVSLQISAAMKDYDAEARGQMRVFLLDCSATLSDCSILSARTSLANPWSPTGGFVTRTFTFGDVEHLIAHDRRLAVKVVVGAGSETDMYIAYAAGEYPSWLTYTESSGSQTTTTTSSTTTTTAPTTTTGATTTTTIAPPTTTTTTTAPTTTTTAPPTTTTTTTPPTTTAPTTTMGATTTTTTVPPVTTTMRATTTTTNAPPVTTTTTGATTTTTTAPPVTTTTTSTAVGLPVDENGTGDIALPSLTDTTAEPLIHDSPMLNAVELLLPDGAAQVVVSPLVVLAVIVDAIFLTGRAVSLTAAGAGVLTAFLLIGFGARTRDLSLDTGGTDA